jgi:large subunit ribosomal protein L22
MGKAKQPRRLGDNEALAIGTMLRVSPQKLGLVAGMIRGMAAGKAVTALAFSPKAAARDVKKVLESAIANAENNHSLDVDRLVVAEASVGKQMVMKRVQARARGRAGTIHKHFSRIRIVVRERVEAAAAAAPPVQEGA